MPKLKTVTARPVVTFDATNAQHRRWVTEYMRTNRWADCPVRFTINSPTGIIIGTIQRQLLEYYTSLEFKE